MSAEREAAYAQRLERVGHSLFVRVGTDQVAYFIEKDGSLEYYSPTLAMLGVYVREIEKRMGSYIRKFERSTIRLLVNPRQTLDDVAPDLPERVPVQPGDIVVQKRGDFYHVFRHEPDELDEIGELVFDTLNAAVEAASEAQRQTAHGLSVCAPAARRESARVIDLARYRS